MIARVQTNQNCLQSVNSTYCSACVSGYALTVPCLFNRDLSFCCASRSILGRSGRLAGNFRVRALADAQFDHGAPAPCRPLCPEYRWLRFLVWSHSGLEDASPSPGCVPSFWMRPGQQPRMQPGLCPKTQPTMRPRLRPRTRPKMRPRMRPIYIYIYIYIFFFFHILVYIIY